MTGRQGRLWRVPSESWTPSRSRSVAALSLTRSSGLSRSGTIPSKHTTYSGSKSSNKKTNTTPTSSGGSGNPGGGNGGGGNNSSTTSKQKHAEQVFDWVARTLTKFKDTVENISNRINDYVSSAFKKTMLNRQEKAIVEEINANKHGAQSYTNKANSIASGYLTRDTLPELNKILDLASSKTQNDIRKNKRRFG